MPDRARRACLRRGVESPVMDRSSTVLFAHAARRLGAAARAAGLTVPAFRSPPRRSGAPRTIRRLPGGPVVAVVLARSRVRRRARRHGGRRRDRERVCRSRPPRGSGARCSTRSPRRHRVRGCRPPRNVGATRPGWRNGRRRRLKPAGPFGDVEVRLLFRAPLTRTYAIRRLPRQHGDASRRGTRPSLVER